MIIIDPPRQRVDRIPEAYSQHCELAAKRISEATYPPSSLPAFLAFGEVTCINRDNVS